MVKPPAQGAVYHAYVLRSRLCPLGAHCEPRVVRTYKRYNVSRRPCGALDYVPRAVSILRSPLWAVFNFLFHMLNNKFLCNIAYAMLEEFLVGVQAHGRLNG